MRKILPILGFMFCLCWQTAEAQERRVTGSVRDATTNEPLPGVSVLIDGTTAGAVTDYEGNFALSVNPPATLIFSFIGYVNQRVSVGNRSTIDVQLVEDVQQLSEVVVVGYGTQQLRDATGAVASVKSEDFNQGVIASPEELIQGKAAGVQITTASGEPGAGVNIRIRGTSSVRANNNPLFVVDGVPLAGDDVSAGGQDTGRGTSSARNPLNFLNPNDIASIDILKDASATAIYGSRGANGVVLITTKSGRGLRQQIDFTSSLSVGTPARRFDMLDREEFLTQAERLGSDVEALDRGSDTNWQDEVLRTAITHRHDLAYGNSYGTGDYRVAIGYQDQQGVIKNSNMERMTARLNWNQSFIDERLKFGVQATVSRINDEQPLITDNAGFEGDLIGTMYMANPTWPSDPTVQLDNTIANPNALLRYYQDHTTTDRQLINANLGFDIVEGLNFRINGGFDNSTSSRAGITSPELFLGNGIFENGRGFLSDIDADTRLMEAILNYEKKFENSSLSAMAGYSYQQFNRSGIDIFGWGFQGTNMNNMVSDLRDASDMLRDAIGLADDGRRLGYQQFGFFPTELIANDDLVSTGFFVNTLFPQVGTTHLPESQRPGNVPVRSVAGDRYAQRDELQSFFGRVNYSLADRFLLTATLRADGSTRFGADNKYGIFPSAAFAWRLSEEAFVPEVFDELKFRLGYGVTGNQEIPHNLFQQRQRWGGISIANDGVVQRPGATTVAFQNRGLGWEQTSQVNMGFDFEFLDRRLGASLDLYRRVTTDLLIRVNSAQPAPQPFVFQNLDADVINQGVEVMLNYAILNTERVGLDFGINASYNHNVVRNFRGIVDTGEISGQGLTGAFAQRIAEGQPLYAFFLREFEGLDDQGLAQYTVDAQQFVGKSPLPLYNLGLNVSARVGNWDAALYGYGMFGHYNYNNTANAFFTIGSLGSGRNITREALEYALETGESVANAPDASTRFLEKADFFRLQNLNLGYNLPIDGGFVKSLRFFGSAQNLFVLTGYSGVDPEINTNKALNDVPSAGIEYTAYPRARVFTLGFNASF